MRVSAVLCEITGRPRATAASAAAAEAAVARPRQMPRQGASHVVWRGLPTQRRSGEDRSRCALARRWESLLKVGHTVVLK